MRTGLDRVVEIAQDGDLTLDYDQNGNRTSVGYPGGVTADYTFDFADRETSLSVTTPAGTADVCLQRQIPTGTTDYHIFYLAGRPVGQVALESGQPERWWYFTTDHLGTLVVATDSNQDELWVNRFDPFGEDPLAGTSSGASEQELFLRFPGQWDEPVWREAMMGAEGYQNVHRWYTPATGRYSRVDPLRLGRTYANSYLYVGGNPTSYIDPLALLRCKCDDDCPSGQWTYSGWGASIVAAGGVSISRGTFTCLDNDRVKQPVKALCGLLGPMVGGGVGGEGSTPFAPSGCGCNREDLLGDGQTALTGSAGPLSLTVSGCDQPGPFSIGDRTATAGGFKSTGAGLAWIRCEVTPREGWWDWNYTADD